MPTIRRVVPVTDVHVWEVHLEYDPRLYNPKQLAVLAVTLANPAWADAVVDVGATGPRAGRAYPPPDPAHPDWLTPAEILAHQAKTSTNP